MGSIKIGMSRGRPIYGLNLRRLDTGQSVDTSRHNDKVVTRVWTNPSQVCHREADKLD